jgi:hypothetical protein
MSKVLRSTTEEPKNHQNEKRNKHDHQPQLAFALVVVFHFCSKGKKTGRGAPATHKKFDVYAKPLRIG